MKHIILLTDFSATARNAALFALKMFKDQPISYQLLNCFDVDFSGSPYILQVKEELAAESRRSLREELSALHAQFPNARIKPLSAFGPITEVIRKEIESHHSDLIVLGCKGETALEHLLLGSNALEVINNIHHPMLVVPIDARFVPPKKIVFATDLHKVSIDKMADTLTEVVSHYNSELLFLILEDDTLNHLEIEEKVSGYFPGIKTDFHFMENTGDACKNILAFMDEKEANLLALIRHHYNFFEKMFNPNIIKKMVLQPQHPMLILPEKVQSQKTE